MQRFLIARRVYTVVRSARCGTRACVIGKLTRLSRRLTVRFTLSNRRNSQIDNGKSCGNDFASVFDRQSFFLFFFLFCARRDDRGRFENSRDIFRLVKNITMKFDTNTNRKNDARLFCSLCKQICQIVCIFNLTYSILYNFILFNIFHLTFVYLTYVSINFDHGRSSNF